MEQKNTGSNKQLFTLLIAIVIGLVAGFFVGALVGVLLAIIGGVAAYLYFNKGNNTETNNATEEHRDEGPNLEAVLSGLADLNLQIRLNANNEIAIQSFEKTIDALLNTLPRVDQALESGELKWVVYRIATDYLPNRAAMPYLSLDSVKQGEEKVLEELQAGQEAMRGELKEVETLIDQKNETEFSTKAKFLKHRFNIS